MTKDNVLAILKENGSYISGEEISRKLNISRAAVNLAVKSLKQLGYDILSSTKKGYILRSNPDLINNGEFINLLGEEIKRLTILDEVDSTNNYLKKKALENPLDGEIVLANKQTKAKGRMGRSFITSEGCGIYLSYLMMPKNILPNIASITAWISVGVSKAIERVYGITPSIKWVNDLLINNKKIAGILTEMAIEGDYIQYMVIGVGINVNEESFPDEIKNIASSLYLETGRKINRSILISEIIKELDKIRLTWPNDDSYYDYYLENSMLINKEVVIIKGGNEKTSIVKGIDKNFGLILSDGTILNSGEVTIRRK